MTSGYAYGISAQQWVESGYTVAGGYLAGLYAQLTVQGTMNGAGAVACAIEGYISNGGTWTSINILSNLWLDTHLDRTPSAGSVYFIYCSNNGSASKCTYDAVIRVNGEKSTKALFELNNCVWDVVANGMVGSNNTGGGTLDFSNWRTVKVNIDGTTHYLVAAQTIADS